MPGLLAAATGSEFDSPHARSKVIKVQPHAVAERGRRARASTSRSRSMIHTAQQRSQVALPSKNAPRHDSPRLARRAHPAPPKVAIPALPKTMSPAIPVKPATEALPAVTTPVASPVPPLMVATAGLLEANVTVFAAGAPEVPSL